VSWIAPPEPLQDDSRTDRLLGPHLYDGVCGAAFFLAAYYSVTESAEARELCLRCLAPVCAKMKMLSESVTSNTKAIAIGGIVGLASIAYVLAWCADWLRYPQLSDLAFSAARALTPERIAADDKLDVVAGSAGVLLAMLALCRKNQDTSARDDAVAVARLCAHRLLRRRGASETTGEPRGWSGTERPPLSGFAHGASGICYALLRFSDFFGSDAQCREAALGGFTFERGLYDPDKRAWLDLRFGRPLDQHAWCHGAPGITLARLHALDLADREIRDDLETALSITAALPDLPRDHLCCGNFGLAEILHSAGQSLERDDLVDSALRLADRRLKRAMIQGFCFNWPDHNQSRGSSNFHPSLFLGEAGIGYTLLRFLYPGRFPSVLLLQ